MNISRSTFFRGGILITLATLVFIFIFISITHSNDIDNENSFIKTNADIQLRIQRISYLTNEEKTSLKNFILSKEFVHLDELNRNDSALIFNLKELSGLLTPLPINQKKIDSLHYSIDNLIRFSKEIIQLNQSNNKIGYYELLSKIENYNGYNTISTLLSSISAWELSKQYEFSVQENLLFRNMKTIFFISLITVLILILLLIIKLYYDFKKQTTHFLRLSYAEKLFANSFDAIISTDENCIITGWNKGAELMYHYTEKEVIGKSTKNILKDNLDEREIQEVFNNLSNKGYWKADVEQKNREGETLHVRASISAIKNAQEKIIGYLAINSNNTELKEAEREITVLEKMAETTSDAVIITDEHMVIKMWNPGAEKFYGYSSKEVIGKKATQLLNIKLSQEEFLRIRDVLRERNFWNGEIQQVAKDNLQVEMLCSITAIKNSDNKITQYVAISREISDIKKAESALKEFNEQLERKVAEKTNEIIEIFDRVSDAFIALDNNFCYTFLNKKAEEIFGLKFSEVEGKRIWDIFPNCDGMPFYHAFHKALQQQENIHFEDYFEGSNKWFQNNIYPSVNGLSVYYRDISEEKKAREELVKMNYRLRNLSVHLQNAREDERKYIAKEVHDQFGQQMTALKMDMAWLKKKVLPDNPSLEEKMNEMILLIEETINTVRKILLQLRPSILDDIGLIAALEWQIKEVKKRSDINCTFYHKIEEDNIPDEVKTNIFRICQESLTNIQKHAQATEINCSIIQKDNKIIFSIYDNGVGFDINQKNQSFGLLGMQERALMLKGNLKIESNKGEGTMVRLEVLLDPKKI